MNINVRGREQNTMKIHVYKKEDNNDYTFSFVEEQTKGEIAKAIYDRETYFLYQGNKYTAGNKPLLTEVIPVPIEYPVSTKMKKFVGFSLLKSGEKICEYYQESVTYGKGKVFKKNMVFDVFKFENENYFVYPMVSKKIPDPFYCIQDEMGKTTGIIERHKTIKNKCVTSISIEDETDLLHFMLIAFEETILGLYEEDGFIRDKNVTRRFYSDEEVKGVLTNLENEININSY